MTDDLERLEALAMAATPGPWEWKDRDGWYELEDQEGYRIADDGTACGEYGGWMELPTEPNAAFIAAANPAAILSLIQRVREAEAHVERLQLAVGEASKTAWTRGRADALE